MLTSVSNLTPRARLIQSRVAGTRVLAATASSVLLRHRQQSRGFRFGWWADEFDHEQRREMRRRYKALRHKYSDALNRKLLWEQQQSSSGEVPRANKRLVNHYWQPKRCFAFGRHRATKDVFKTPENPTGVRPGQNIEDVERGAWGHFLFRDGEGSQPSTSQQSAWTSPFDDIRSYISKRQSDILKETNFGASGTYSTKAAKPEDDYVVDPITNRKISKSSAKSTPDESVDIPATTFKTYRSQFVQPGASTEAGEAPISFDGPPAPAGKAQETVDTDLPPTAAELRAYKDVVIDEIPSDEASRSTAADSGAAGTHKPVLQSEEYVREHQPDPSAISDSTETNYMSWKYKGVFWGRDDGSTRVDQTSGHFDGLPSASELSSLDAASEAPKYSDLDKYKPVQYNEPDGKPPGHAENETYADVQQYKPVEYNEPDGKLPEAESSYDQAELEEYRPVTWNEPDGKPTTPPVELGQEGYDPEEVAQYKPVRWNEPDGKPDTPVELGHEGYDPAEVAKYKPFFWNEPDGQPTTPVELGHEGYDPAEVQQYKPFMYNEPDGKPPMAAVELGHEGYDPAEVQKYQPFRYNEPDGKPPVDNVEKGHEGYDPAEVQQYKPFMYNEPDGKPEVVTGEIGHEGYDPVEVQQYKPFKYNEPDGKAPEDAELVADSSELSSYGAVRYQEPDGKPEPASDSAAESLREYDARSDEAESTDEVYSNVLRGLGRLSHLDGEKSVQESDSRSFDAGLARGKQSTGNTRDRETLESSMTRMNAEADAIDTLAKTSVKSIKSRARKRLTDEQRKQAFVDPYSTEPQGLETSFAEECDGKTTWPTYVKIHKAVNREDTSSATETTAFSLSSTSEPAVYKILAYDPTMQTINIAETTSAVPDMASPLSPAEVLLRLSNPTKFFPHFKPLQTQGFEIVSGSGDVLVFRKVRDADEIGQTAASPEPATSAAASSSLKTQDVLSATINPIDKTGTQYVSPSAANFASPTGYVNLDLPFLHDSASSMTNLPPPPSATTKPSRRYQSSAGVRREEPVFSGPKDGKVEAPAEKKASIGKRVVVGATWVAGVSYALGVVSEYIKGP